MWKCSQTKRINKKKTVIKPIYSKTKTTIVLIWAGRICELFCGGGGKENEKCIAVSGGVGGITVTNAGTKFMGMQRQKFQTTTTTTVMMVVVVVQQQVTNGLVLQRLHNARGERRGFFRTNLYKRCR